MSVCAHGAACERSLTPTLLLLLHCVAGAVLLLAGCAHIQVYEAISGGADDIDLNGRTINARAYCSW